MNNYLLISFIIAIGALLIFFISFEKGKPKLKNIMCIVTICAIASVGRVIFNFVPQVQPVTAIVIITGLCFGSQSGFLVGALTALVSNMMLGQGPWTPWQMLAWGIIGLISGLLSKSKYTNNLWFLCPFSFLAGILFSVFMDVYTVMSFGEQITKNTVLTVFGTGILFNISHCVANVIFMLLLYKPLEKKFNRIKNKYGIIS